MALVISAVQVTGTATAYTVPAGKIAKVRLVSFDSFDTTYSLFIGNYTAKNSARNGLNTENQGQDGALPTSMAVPVLGYVRGATNGISMQSQFMYIKEDHVLVAGETVSCNYSAATFAYTIFEEDV
jgi:hypothetical protein